MKNMIKTFGVAFACAAGLMAGIYAAPMMVEKVKELAKQINFKKGEN